MESGMMSGFRGTPEGHLGGKYVRKLEGEFRDYFKVKHAIAMQSATAALHAACLAYDIGPGDEVLVTPYSFVASASCVLMAGAKPVFADIENDIFNMNPFLIPGLITPKTKAIIPVHLHGHMARMNVIMHYAREYNLKIIEDAAQSIGATYANLYAGTMGDCGVFSFNQSKQISSGEGGMLVTNEDKIAEIVRAIRNHGEVSCNSTQVGYNYRMGEIEAAIVSEQFQHLEKNIKHRTMLADYMTEQLSEIDGLTPPIVYGDCRHAFYTYAVKYDENKIGMPRDVFQKKLKERGVYFGSGYVKPLHLLPIFGGHEGQCPVAERMWKKTLCVFDWLKYPTTKKDIDEAIEVIKEVINGNNKEDS